MLSAEGLEPCIMLYFTEPHVQCVWHHESQWRMQLQAHPSIRTREICCKQWASSEATEMCCAVTVMDVPAGGTLATRLEQSWFGGANAPGPPPRPSAEQPRRPSIASDTDGGPIGSSDAGSRDEDAVETSSAVAESIGRSVRSVLLANCDVGALASAEVVDHQELSPLPASSMSSCSCCTCD